MKKFIFIVTKKIDKTITILAENKEEAVENLLTIALKSNEINFENNSIIDTKYEANLKSESEFNNNVNDIKSIDLKDIFSEEEMKNFIGGNEEIEDDLPKEYDEIVCRNCGNCIPIDKIL